MIGFFSFSFWIQRNVAKHETEKVRTSRFDRPSTLAGNHDEEDKQPTYGSAGSVGNNNNDDDYNNSRTVLDIFRWLCSYLFFKINIMCHTCNNLLNKLVRRYLVFSFQQKENSCAKSNFQRFIEIQNLWFLVSRMPASGPSVTRFICREGQREQNEKKTSCAKLKILKKIQRNSKFVIFGVKDAGLWAVCYTFHLSRRAKRTKCDQYLIYYFFYW